MRLLKPFTLVAMLALTAASFAAQCTPPSKLPSLQGPNAMGHKAPKRPMLVEKQSSNSIGNSQRQNFDKGIYLPRYADGQSTCAAIMSYNFSSGDNPQLESITTCTPARPHSVYRTNYENKKRPQGPVLQLISSPQSSSAK